MSIRFTVVEGLTGAQCKFFIGPLTHLKRHFHKKMKMPFKHDVKELDGYFFAASLMSCNIFLKDYRDTPKCNNDLQHEINHFVKYVIRNCGLGQNEEIHSYMIGEITQLFKNKYNYYINNKQGKQPTKKVKRKK